MFFAKESIISFPFSLYEFEKIEEKKCVNGCATINWDSVVVSGEFDLDICRPNASSKD